MRQSRIAGFCFRFPAFATVTTTHHMTAQLHVFRSSVATYIVLNSDSDSKCESSVDSFPRISGCGSAVFTDTMTCG